MGNFNHGKMVNVVLNFNIILQCYLLHVLKYNETIQLYESITGTLQRRNIIITIKNAGSILSFNIKNISFIKKASAITIITKIKFVYIHLKNQLDSFCRKTALTSII